MLVNPYDSEAVAEALHDAFRMPVAERTKRMRKLRRRGRYANVFRWCEEIFSFIEDRQPWAKDMAA